MAEIKQGKPVGDYPKWISKQEYIDMIVGLLNEVDENYKLKWCYETLKNKLKK